MVFYSTDNLYPANSYRWRCKPFQLPSLLKRNLEAISSCSDATADKTTCWELLVRSKEENPSFELAHNGKLWPVTSHSDRNNKVHQGMELCQVDL